MTEKVERLSAFRSPTVRRLVRAYGPVILIALLFLLMVLLVPTLERTVGP